MLQLAGTGTVVTPIPVINPAADGAKMWVRGDDPTFNGFNDADLVPSWYERGAARPDNGDWSPDSGTNPIWKASGPNGKPFVRFSAGKYLRSTGFGGTYKIVTNQTYNLFFVVAPNQAGSGGGSWSDPHIWGDADDRFNLSMRGGNILEATAYPTGNSFWSAPYTIGQFYLVEMWPGTTANTINISINGGTPVVGAWNAGLANHNCYFHGHAYDMAEAIGFMTDMGATLRSNYRAALKAKYGL